MRSRGQLALYVVAANAAAIAVLYTALYVAMSGGFREVERVSAEENLRRLHQAIAVESDQLRGIVGDWAPWDDTYEFVQDRNEAYVDSNLVPSVLTNFDIDFMVFMDAEGAVVHSFAAEDVSAATALVRHLDGQDELLRHDREASIRSGFVTTDGTSVLVAAAPIVHSDLSGPIMGTLLVGRVLDRAMLDRLEARTLLPLEIHSTSAPLPAPVAAAWADPGTEDGAVVVPVNRDRIDGYLPVADVYGDPALVVRATLARPVAAQARDVGAMVAAILVLLGVLAGIVEYVLLRRLFASRRALHQANQDLERRVQERTEQLEQLNAKLKFDAFHDALTGLPNRALLHERLGHALARRNRRPAEGLAVVFLDVDRFKVINDRKGHAAGDELLVEIANRLRSAVRSSDTIARLGGDEFTIVLEGVADTDAALETVARIQERMQEPMLLQGYPVNVSLSAGVVMSDDTYATPDELLRDADIAMYRAKIAGRANTRVFTPEGRERTLDHMAT